MSNETTIQPLVWGDLWDAMRADESDWHPTTAEMYDEMLNVLPPRAWIGGAFLVGEAHHDRPNGETVYAAFNHSFGLYSARYMTVREFKETFGGAK